MPFDGKNVPEHVPEDQRERWAAVWNDVYQKCIEGGGSTEACEPRAFAAANALLDEEKKMKSAEQDSFERLRNRLSEALHTKLGPDWWIPETFADYLIARGREGKLYRLEWSEATDGSIVLGEPQEVETAYLPVAEAARFLAREADAGDDTGWPVQIIEAGEAKGTACGVEGCATISHVFTPEVVAQFALAANKARFGRRHPGPFEDEGDPGRIAGWLENGRIVGNAAHATMRLFENEMDLKAKLDAARKADKLDLFALSVLAYVAFKPGKFEGKDALVSERLHRLVSVDLVTEAGAGGKFLNPLRVAAAARGFAEIAALQKQALAKSSPSANPESRPEASGVGAGVTGGRKDGTASDTAHGRTSEGGAKMKDRILKVLETLRKFDAGRADELNKEFDGLPEEQHVEFLAKVTEALAALETQVNARASKTLQELELRAARMNRDDKIAEAKLPAEAAKLVREHLDLLGRAYTDAEIDSEIKRVREAFAAYSRIGKISAEGGVQVGWNSLDKVQAAMDAMFGVKAALADKNVRPFRGIKEAYIRCTGDDDCSEIPAGGFYKVSEVILTTTFPNILKNSMTKRLIQDYEEVGLGGLEQVINETEVADFKTQDRVRQGYLADLATVAENAAYVEFTAPTDEIINYAIAKRGNFQDITWETIVNDDTGKLRAYPTRIARAARRTLKQFITDFFVTNPLYDPDALAWFVAGHSNLGSLAISDVELDAREIALAKQTEKDSGKRLGLSLDWVMVPVDLKPTVFQINNNNDGANSWYARFATPGPVPMGQLGKERIIVNELLTDINDWYGGSLPGRAPSLEIAYLQGFGRAPQIFTVSQQQMLAIAAIDKIRIFGVFPFGGDIIDFRPVFKNVVP